MAVELFTMAFVFVSQEIEAAIKAYPFRQPRDEKAALEGMSAIVRDMENGNIKSREDLHKVSDCDVCLGFSF